MDEGSSVGTPLLELFDGCGKSCGLHIVERNARRIQFLEKLRELRCPNMTDSHPYPCDR